MIFSYEEATDFGNSANLQWRYIIRSEWYYPAPKDAAKQIKDHVAFWRGVKIEL